MATPGTTEVTNGSCLCGSITYTISGAPATTLLCHCTSCKKSSGSSFMANGFYPEPQLNITSVTTNLKKYEDTSSESGGIVERSFCGNCGSSLFLKSAKLEGLVIVASGTLDGVEGLKDWKPQAEYFCKRKVPWLEGSGVDDGKQFNAMT